MKEMLDTFGFEGQFGRAKTVQGAVNFLNSLESNPGQKVQADLVLASYDPRYGSAVQILESLTKVDDSDSNDG